MHTAPADSPSSPTAAVSSIPFVPSVAALRASAADRRVERAAAAFAVAALGIRMDVTLGITVGVGVAIVLVPVWARAFATYRASWAALTVVALAIGNGVALMELARGSRPVDVHGGIADVTLLLEIVVGVGVFLWARTVLPAWAVASWFGVGMLVWAVAHPTGGGLNLWKFDLAIPVGVLVLGLASRGGRPAAGIAAALGLAAVSVVFDSRAYASALVLVALLLVWRSLPAPARSGGSRGRRSWGGIVVLAAAVAGVLYLLASQLLVSGLLGAAAAERSQAQIDTSGSLILGGRPEIAATWALLRYHPLGFGFGVVPRYDEVLAAKTGMAAINYDPDNGYVDKYMFGGHFELHSIVGDLFALAGPGGLLLTAAMVFAAAAAVGRGIAHRTGDAVLFFAAVWTLWNVPFSPLTVSVPVVVLLGGLVLAPRAATPVPHAPV